MNQKTLPSRLHDTLRQAYALHQKDQLDAAWQLYEKVLAQDPKQPDALHLSGCIANQRHAYAQAVQRIGAALAEVGPNPPYLVNYGNALASLHQHAQAEAAWQQALALDPAFSAARNNLANLLVRLGRYEQAMAEFEQTLVQAPQHLNALLTLGRLLCERGQAERGLQLLDQALSLAPDNAQVRLTLAKAQVAAGQPELAIQTVEAQRLRQPNSDEALTGAGDILFALQHFGESMACYRQAIQRNADNASALAGLLRAQLALGQTAQALELIHQHLQADQPAPWLQSWRLSLLRYQADLPAHELVSAHQDWNARFALPIASDPSWDAVAREPDRRLRIAYVSENFCARATAVFLEPMLAQHDGAQFELYAYHNASQFDGVAQRLHALVPHWREVANLSDQALAELIRADQIDILVDLDGHGGHNRLLTFARKPAPIQISGLGYPGSTGLSAIRYRLGAALADPSPAESSETVLSLPGGPFCYRPDANDSAEVITPNERRSGITFGSFNSAASLSPALLACWADILHACPDARLLFCADGFADELACAPVRAAFAGHGIAAERMAFAKSAASAAERNAVYGLVDLALDAFPCNASTATCDALWLGVPVLTLRTEQPAGQMGASLLHACGLDELIASNPDDYRQRALELARDAPRLAQLRSSLRQRLQDSALMDERGWVRQLEASYRQIWQDWCADTTQPGGPLAAPHWQLRLGGDISLCVPASFTAMTPAVLLEQEDWFEAEVGFVRTWLQPGMQVIDIGANYGVYTLSAARQVGPQGRVWAFEPAPNTRRFLAASVAANHFSQVSVEAPALSDRTGQAWIELNWDPELNSLVDGPQAGHNTERITITTLDAWYAANPLAKPDFIKLDAEGHEHKILVGGQRLLGKTSPLVMFELRHRAEVNSTLVNDFKALGYASYQLLPGLGLLTAFSAKANLDPFALNLFACKPDRAAKLAAIGRLLPRSHTGPAQLPKPPAHGWQALLPALPALAAYHAGWLAAPASTAVALADVHLSLAAYAQAISPALPAAQRVARLAQALAAAQRASAAQPSPLRWHTLARLAQMSGARALAVHAMRQALTQLDQSPDGLLDEPFLPALARFDALVVEQPLPWLQAATLQAWLERYCFAGAFANAHDEQPLLERAAQLPYFPPALERRRQLLRIKLGQQTGAQYSPLLSEASVDNRNPEFWHQCSTGKVRSA